MTHNAPQSPLNARSQEALSEYIEADLLRLEAAHAAFVTNCSRARDVAEAVSQR